MVLNVFVLFFEVYVYGRLIGKFWIMKFRIIIIYVNVGKGWKLNDLFSKGEIGLGLNLDINVNIFGLKIYDLFLFMCFFIWSLY